MLFGDVSWMDTRLVSIDHSGGSVPAIDKNTTGASACGQRGIRLSLDSNAVSGATWTRNHVNARAWYATRGPTPRHAVQPVRTCQAGAHEVDDTQRGHLVQQPRHRRVEGRADVLQRDARHVRAGALHACVQGKDMHGVTRGMPKGSAGLWFSAGRTVLRLQLTDSGQRPTTHLSSCQCMGACPRSSWPAPCGSTARSLRRTGRPRTRAVRAVLGSAAPG